MNKNPVRRAVLRRLRLCTLACFVQFAVINDGYTYFLNGVQPARPASSLQSVISFTFNVHKTIALGGAFSMVSGPHALITKATLKSLEWLRGFIREGFQPRRAVGKAVLGALPGMDAFAEADRIEAKREDYIGGKRETWTKFEAPRLDDIGTVPIGGWDRQFVDEVVSTARQALRDHSRPRGKQKNFTQRIHYSSGDEPEEAIRTDGFGIHSQSPGSLKAGWLFYYEADSARGGLR